MKEYLTDAFILGRRALGESDRMVELYTKDFGRIEVKVVGGRKILSKLSPHLDFLNLVTIRLIQKRQFTLTDARVNERFVNNANKTLPERAKFLDLIFILRSITPLLESDLHLWYFLTRSLRTGRINIADFLKLSGYNPSFAFCYLCRNKNVSVFESKTQTFFCSRCSIEASQKEIISF